MTSYVNMGLSIAGAALGLSGLIVALIAGRDARRCQAHSRAVECSLEATRRQFELLVRSRMKAGRTADRRAAEPLDRAIDSARLGATPRSLAQKFGLSHLEAELVSRLHGRKKTG
jgi:hypothetical protein